MTAASARPAPSQCADCGGCVQSLSFQPGFSVLRLEGRVGANPLLLQGRGVVQRWEASPPRPLDFLFHSHFDYSGKSLGPLAGVSALLF